MSDDRKRGIVSGFHMVKGWGFIIPDDGGPDLFVHASEVIRPENKRPGEALLASGQSVLYTEKNPEPKEGPRAINVEVIRDGEK